MEAELLERDFGDTDPKLHALLCRIAEERLGELPLAEPLTQRVRETIAAELRGGNPSVECIAQRLHMSRRTLARKLDSKAPASRRSWTTCAAGSRSATSRSTTSDS